jgi:hypothetical protein
VRTRKNSDDLSIHGSTHVGSLEGTFLDMYGLRAQVCIRVGGKGKYTDGSFDEYSLAAVERHAEGAGWDVWD